MTKHVLCCIDLTHAKDSIKVLLEADRQARIDDAKLTVMTVIPDYGSSWVGSFFKEGTLKEAANAASEALKTLIKTTLPDRKGTKTVVEIGVVYEQVLHQIDQLKVDLIVLGAHKPSVLDHLMGPNAAHIVRTSPVSALIVRPG
ncbi:universal stress protein [Marinomonas sp. A79]|uniref:Universal stress protein n=1 Tax=Marinomonas vulgaris TaxID=2823372 RepID=A0ABS5H8I8_9GAMM|nr:universal stress protein [Marinomonas vulgaris]MBR7887644.1 universal stress protein [Marinomonas vulgaris]